MALEGEDYVDLKRKTLTLCLKPYYPPYSLCSLVIHCMLTMNGQASDYLTDASQFTAIHKPLTQFLWRGAKQYGKRRMPTEQFG